PVRSGALVAVRCVDGRLEPGCLGRDARLLHDAGFASACHSAVANPEGGLMADHPPRLPGNPTTPHELPPILPADHAPQYGAVRILEGQLAVRRGGRGQAAIREMNAQEARHLAVFETLLCERRVRPTALQPLWHIAGFALGAATALLGEQAAMACTVAVEE